MTTATVLASLFTSALVIYGGGQIPTANYVMGKLSECLLALNLDVYGVKKSYWGLTDISCYEKLSLEKARNIQNELGTYFQMCRNVDPSSANFFDDILNNLKKFNIHLMFICGGDGSLRGANDFLHRCQEIDYEMKIIFIPCTIDGMNGTRTLGFTSAVSESIYQTELITRNAFATWDYGLNGPRIPIIEVQGRNRNDILFEAVNHFKLHGLAGYLLSDINLIALPSGHNWSMENLLSKINCNSKPTVIICAEGARANDFYWNLIPSDNASQKISKLINELHIFKSNCQLVGYLSQTNNKITVEDKIEIDNWCKIAVSKIENNDSLAIINSSNGFNSISIETLASINQNAIICPLSHEELVSLKEYLP